MECVVSGRGWAGIEPAKLQANLPPAPVDHSPVRPEPEEVDVDVGVGGRVEGIKVGQVPWKGTSLYITIPPCVLNYERAAGLPSP
jgi:hypothetical protein